MEKLSVQNKGQINITDIELPNEKDINFKPGIHDLVHSFLNDDYSKLLSLEEQIEHIKIYNKIFLFIILLSLSVAAFHYFILID